MQLLTRRLGYDMLSLHEREVSALKAVACFPLVDMYVSVLPLIQCI